MLALHIGISRYWIQLILKSKITKASIYLNVFWNVGSWTIYDLRKNDAMSSKSNFIAPKLPSIEILYNSIFLHTSRDIYFYLYVYNSYLQYILVRITTRLKLVFNDLVDFVIFVHIRFSSVVSQTKSLNKLNRIFSASIFIRTNLVLTNWKSVRNTINFPLKTNHCCSLVPVAIPVVKNCLKIYLYSY